MSTASEEQGLESGEIPIPAPRREQMWFSVAGTDDPAVLGPEAFAQRGALDEAAPDALLGAQAAAMAGDVAVLESMSDNALLGLVGAGRKLAARAAAIQQRAVAEFARRRVPAPGAKPSRRGFVQFSADELAWQLVLNHNQAEAAMDQAATAERRLPKVCGRLWDGRISEYQMKIIATGVACLTDEGAAEADEILATAVPGLTPGQTRAMVARVVLMIDPDAAQEQKKDAAKRARVEKFQEFGGTAALSGRDLPVDAVLASWQHIDARAKALKAAGFNDDLERLRAAVYLALLTGGDPVTMLTALKTAAGDAVPVASPEKWSRQEQDESGSDEDNDGAGGARRGPRNPTGPKGPTGGCRTGTEGTGAAPFAASINLLVPVGTLFERGAAPGQIPGFGPLDPETTRDLVQAASAHAATRWCITTIGADGAAKEHGCVPGQHRWSPAAPPKDPTSHRTGGGNRDGPGRAPEPDDPVPGDEEQLAAEGFLDRLRVTLVPIATGDQGCDHAHCTGKYEVPLKLKHLIKARKDTCVAPGCNWPADTGDADHTIPWPQGPTCQENLGAPCRYHHRGKQAPGWKLGQPKPGFFEWTSPSGRTKMTTPASYFT